MKSAVYLRIASVLTLVHAVLHTVGGVFGAVPPGPATVAAAAMKANEFVVFGVTRTYWQFLRGMGLAVSIFLTIEAVVFWQLGALAKRDGAGVRPMLVAFMVAYLAMAVNSYEYFFMPPVVTEILIVVCLGLAWMSAGAPVGAGGVREATAR
jgi:hypothetical protein